MLMKIHTLDLKFQRVSHAIAAYLVIGPAGPVLVETGPASTLENLKSELARHGFTPWDIRHVLVTHIHLDHAGAAGWWAQHGAHVYVHQIGATHLIDPSKLLASASRIYEDRMELLWGKTIPAPADKVIAVEDKQTINAGGLNFVALDTPGHAWHHHTYQLNDIAFTGDAAGILIPDCHLIDLPAPPPEFKLEVWLKTIDFLLTRNFAAIYPTHFGRVENVSEHLKKLRNLLTEAAEFVRTRMEANVTREILIKEYTGWNRERARYLGLTEEAIYKYETANPWYMSVDGIMRYWRKRGVT